MSSVKDGMILAIPLLSGLAGYAMAMVRFKSQGGHPFASLELDERGPRSGADRGVPVVKMKTFDPGNTLGAGVWECSPGGFTVASRPNTETLMVISGEGTITNSDGTQVRANRSAA
ncbi:MAG: hypothetical protein SGPRY_014511 [Prymnesium sp.]